MEVSARRLLSSGVARQTATQWQQSARVSARSSRSFTSAAAAEPRKPRYVTLLPGDGIGPEITNSVVGVFRAAEVPILWERFDSIFDPSNDAAAGSTPEDVISSITRNKYALKGPLTTPANAAFASRNLRLRQYLDVFANVVTARNIDGVTTRHSKIPVDLVVVRENTQGEYSGLEQEVERGVVQSIKLTTERASRRIAEFAFQYAVKEGRKKVTCIHKANIQKATDGLFIAVAASVAKQYPQIGYSEMIIDNACMQMVLDPKQFDVVLTPNLYGNFMTNVAAGLVGGPGIMPGANVGSDIFIAESGARHAAKSIAGQNKANPAAMILSGVMMLKHMGLNADAARIEKAVYTVLKDRKVRTPDLGGCSTTKDFTRAVIANL
eukprot:TRINITY_DN6148_c0_g1_i1.p1 TRINITY_DN6148_c0_g1~~TRINITY_DN6148_c0_g1_i1.p1  ORF type:complete len:381 (-),score=101.86 TRINITY_DN6148_c0_g1_i1:205-1347(-)